MKLSDFHIHSTYSDGVLTIPEIIDLYGKRGFKIIAITDHLCESGSFLGKTARYLNKTLTQENFNQYLNEINQEGQRALLDYGMMVIPGVEFTKNSFRSHRSAHILALGVSEYISADLNILELLEKIKLQSALSIAAHPVSTRTFEFQTYELWNNRDSLASLIDAWEVASGRFLFDEVLRSGLPMIASSDLHHPRQIQSWKTLLRCDLDLDSIFKAIVNQDLQLTFYQEGSVVLDNKLKGLIMRPTAPEFI